MNIEQFRPDQTPRLPAQVAARQFAIRRPLHPTGLYRPHVAAPREALIEIGLVDTGQGRQAAPVLDTEFGLHPRIVATRYGNCKGFTANRYVKMDSTNPSELLERLSMETAGERRRRKLRELCERHGRTVVAERSHTNPFALDQVIKGVLLPAKNDGTRSPRSLGDAAARSIEKAFDLPEGWFDAPEQAEGLSREAVLVAQAYEKMTPTERMRLDRLMAAALDVLPETELEDRGGMSGFGELDEDLAVPQKKKRV